MKELVELSTRHGILTPYTSFLADETVRPLADAGAVRRARESLTELDRAEGLGGVAQRAEKGRFQNATNAAAPSLNIPQTSGALGGGLPGPITTNSFRDLKTDKEVAADSVRAYGNGVFYARSGPVAKNEAGVAKRQQIVVTPETANLDLEKDKDQIEIVDRFSDSYFAIVKANSIAENQMLSQQRDGEQLLIKLRGKNYLVR